MLDILRTRVRIFEEVKNDVYLNRLNPANKQKIVAAKKTLQNRNLNLKSSREETSYNRDKK